MKWVIGLWLGLSMVMQSASGASLQGSFDSVGRSYWPQQSDAVIDGDQTYVVVGDDSGVTLWRKNAVSGETATTLIRGDNSSAYSRLAVAADGSTVLVAYADENQLMIYRSTDGGRTFAVTLTDTFFRNTADVTLLRFKSSFHFFTISGAIMTLRSDDGGATWSPRRSVDPGADVAIKASYAVNEQGLHALYLNRGARLIYLNSTNGVNWYTSLTGQESATEAPSAVSDFAIAAVGGNVVQYSPSADGAGYDVYNLSRTNRALLSAIPFGGPVTPAVLFALPNGEWCLMDTPYLDGAYRGRYRSSADGGLTWSGSKLIDLGYASDRWCSHCATPLAPQIDRAVSSSGRAGLLWFMNNFYPGNFTVRFQSLVNNDGPPVAWVGDTRHWPESGAIKATTDLWINTESWPMNAGKSAIVVWTTNRVTWAASGLNKAGIDGANDWWNYNMGKFPAGSTVEYAVAVIDASGKYTWDSRGGQNYKAVVTLAPTVKWSGNLLHWPPDSELDAGDDLWINAESWPIGAGQSAVVRYSVSTGSVETWVWNSVSMSKAGVKGNNDWWNRSLGKFPAGTAIKYVVGVTDGNGQTWWTDNGAYKTAKVQAPVLQWAGNTFHWPTAGQVTSTTDVWINCESWPKGAGTGGMVVYSTDGSTWTAASLKANGQTTANDKWHINLGLFAKGTTIRFAVMVRDGNGNEKWDSRGGQNYIVTVN